jgi:hypothetical protein
MTEYVAAWQVTAWVQSLSWKVDERVRQGVRFFVANLAI